MDFSNPAAYLYCFYLGLIMAGGLLAALSASLIRALAGLVLTFFGVAGMYLLMLAVLPALMQILIYVGAVVIIIFYAVMASQGYEEGLGRKRLPLLLAAVPAGFIPAGLLAFLCLYEEMPLLAQKPLEVALETLGHDLLNQYFLAFELMAGMLFVAMIGALTLCRKPEKTARKPGKEKSRD